MRIRVSRLAAAAAAATMFLAGGASAASAATSPTGFDCGDYCTQAVTPDGGSMTVPAAFFPQAVDQWNNFGAGITLVNTYWFTSEGAHFSTNRGSKTAMHVEICNLSNDTVGWKLLEDVHGIGDEWELNQSGSFSNDVPEVEYHRLSSHDCAVRDVTANGEQGFLGWDVQGVYFRLATRETDVLKDVYYTAYKK